MISFFNEIYSVVKDDNEVFSHFLGLNYTARIGIKGKGQFVDKVRVLLVGYSKLITIFSSLRYKNVESPVV